MNRFLLKIAALAALTPIAALSQTAHPTGAHAAASTSTAIKNVFWQPDGPKQGSPAFFTVELERPASRVTGSWVNKTLTFFKTDDPKLRATALLIRGDLNWQMANAPALPTTRPESNNSRSSDDYLSSAESAYNEVVRPPQDANRAAVVSARFGLAAISENRHEWDKASKAYQQIIDDPTAGKEFTEMAKMRQDSLRLLEKPVVLGTPMAREPRIKSELPKPSVPSTPEKLGPALPALPATTQPTISIPSATQPSVNVPATASALAPATRRGSTTKP